MEPNFDLNSMLSYNNQIAKTWISADCSIHENMEKCFSLYSLSLSYSKHHKSLQKQTKNCRKLLETPLLPESTESFYTCIKQCEHSYKQLVFSYYKQFKSLE